MTIRKIVNASISLGEVTAISQDLALINLLITVVVEMQMLFKCIIISFLSLETVQVLNATETGGESIRDECKRKRTWHDDKGQKCLADNGKSCHFPFKYREKVNIAFVVILFQSIFRFILLAQLTTITYPGAAQKV